MKTNKQIILKGFFLISCVVLTLTCGAQPNESNQLTRVQYNHTGLHADLGVGLWAWPFPVDFDNDGDLDLLVNCPDKPFNGLWYFENNGDDQNELLFKAPVWLAESKRNLQLTVIDNEIMAMTPGVVYRDFKHSFFQKPDTIISESFYKHLVKKARFNLWRQVDYDQDGDLDLILALDDWTDYGWDNAFNEAGVWTNGPLHGTVYLIEQEAANTYKKPVPVLAGGQPIDNYSISGALFEDFDGDGDLDLILGEFVDRLSWIENTGTRKHPNYATPEFLKIDGEVLHLDLEMIVPTAADMDQDGHMDLVVGIEDGRVVYLRNTGKTNSDGPIFQKPEYLRQEAQYLKFGALVTPYSVDWDQDGDEDLICGNTAGHIGFIENLDGGNPPQWAEPKYLQADGKTILIQAGENGSIQGPAEKKWGYTTLSVVDWDNDGLLDILYNSIWGKVGWFKNIGVPGKPVLAASKPLEVAWPGDNPKPAWNWWCPEGNTLATQWRTTPLGYDWNQDGLMDLIMLDHEGYLCFWERYEENGQLLLKPGQRLFTAAEGQAFNDKFTNDKDGLLRLNTREAGGSGRRKFCITDWDGDGLPDLLVNSVNVNFLRYKGVQNGRTVLEDMGPVSKHRLAGHTTSPTLVDWDKNGIPDLLIGAEDGHFYYLENPHQNNQQK